MSYLFSGGRPLIALLCTNRYLLALFGLLFLGLCEISSAQASTYTRVYGWGDNGAGTLGNGTKSQYPVPAMTELYGKTIVAVASGAAHSLALDSDGTIYAWGYNGNGQLGNNSTTDSLVPVIVNTTNGVSALYGKTVIAIAAGDNFSLALASDGKVYAWGLNNTFGKLGNNSTADSPVPVAVDTSGVLAGKTITAISAGMNHSLALDSTGKVYAWGINYNTNNNEVIGQLGDGSSVQYSRVPVAVDMSGVLSGKMVTAIGAGFFHSMACTSDGKLYAWGGNYNGMLGNGTTTKSYVPVAVDMSGALSGKSVTAVAMGYVHSLCLASDGTVYGWGFGYNGTNGNGSTAETRVPVAVTMNGALAGKSVVAITAGFYSCVALANDGTVYTWGANFGGALGNNSSSNSDVPVAVNTTSGLSALAGATVLSLGTSCVGNTLVIATSSVLGAPDAPINVTATVTSHQATVSFTSSPSTGGSTITGYTVTASPGGATATGTASPLIVGGLTNGTAYTFTVTATNALGTSVASTASAAVTPPVQIAFRTLAGSGTAGYVNDTGISAQFSYPNGVAWDTNVGKLFVADSANNTIRKVTSAGVVTDFAGTFNSQTGIATDSAGNVYVADTGNHRILKFSPAGSSTVLAGSGSQGSTNDYGTNASFNGPQGIAIDSSGIVYVADSGNHKIRKIALDGLVSTLAGSGNAGYSNGFGDGTSARFNTPIGIAVGSDGIVYVADSGNHAIRKIALTTQVTTLAGNGFSSGFVDATGNAARFNNPTGIAVDGTNTIFVADRNNHAIRKITSAGVVTTLAGSGSSGATNGLGTGALFNHPSGIAVDSSGNLYVADYDNQKIRIGALAVQLDMTSPATANGAVGTAFSYQIAFTGSPTNFAATGLPGGLSVSASTGEISGTPTSTGTFSVWPVATSDTGDGAGIITITIAKQTQAAVSITSSASGTFNSAYTATATGGSGTGALVWALGTGSTAAGAAIDSSSGLVTSTSPGTVVIKVYRAGDADYEASATTSDFTITLGKLSQSALSVTSSASGTFNSAYTATASGGSGTGGVTWLLGTGSTAPGAAITSGGSVSSIGAGTVVIKAIKATDTNYLAATSSDFTITLGKAAQSALSITSSSSGTLNSSYTATTTGGNGTGAITWSLGSGSTASGAAINASSGVVTSTGAGTVVINATKAADTNYLISATTSDFTITLGKAAQSTLSVTSSSSGTFNSSYIASASGGSGSGALSWSLGTGSTASGATINPSSGAVTSSGAGTVVIKATKAADTNYTATTSSDFTITLGKASGTVTLGSLSATYDGSAHAATATTSPASLTVAFTYNGSAVTPTNAGTYTVVGIINDANYQGSAAGSLVIAKATPAIGWSTPANIQYGTALSSTQLNATANIAGSFSYSPASGAVLSTGIQTLNTTFTPADTTNYNSTSAQQSLTVQSLPAFSAQPVDRIVNPGQNAIFAVVANGYPAPTYQWQRLSAGSSTWINLTDGGSYSGTNTATLVVSNITLAMNGDQFRCVATNTVGATASNVSPLTVTPEIIVPSEAVISFTVE